MTRADANQLTTNIMPMTRRLPNGARAKRSAGRFSRQPARHRTVATIWEKLSGGTQLQVLDERVMTEAELRQIAQKIKCTDSYGIIFNLIDGLPKYGRAYDWNVGSILQHLDAELVVSSIQHIGNPAPLYESIGLAWVLGEYRSQDPFIVNFLHDVVRLSKDADAWWRAAFSIEKIGAGDAVTLLKRSLKAVGLSGLEYYLDHINDKRSLIGILLESNVDNLERIIYPRVRREFLVATNVGTVINCCWLIGRLKLIDNDIETKLVSLMRDDNYELKYYTFFALQNNATERLRPILENALSDADPLIRKMAARGVVSVGDQKSLAVLEKSLFRENDQAVVAEITEAIYRLKNPSNRDRLLIELKSYRNENGMISDESDKWYREPGIYHAFAEAEDPENICFNLILQKIGSRRVTNPVDLATGTGRTLRQILEKVNYQGTLHGVDISADMCDFVERNLRRERKYTNALRLERCAIRDASVRLRCKSSLIVSSFGFPSRISNSRQCLDELKAVYELLADDGEFYTIGWDESYNDELSAMWFKYVPDDIQAWDFDEWRRKRIAAAETTRNCGLTWFKRGLAVPLQFGSLREAASVMGYLFGRDAAREIAHSGKTEWRMSLGITRDSKKDLAKTIAAYEKRN